MEAGVDTRELSPLVLAYIGDAYFHLYVRTRLLKITRRIDRLHEICAEIVSAAYQAEVYKKIEPALTDDERAIFRRGRNAKSHAPRVATVAEYHASTGFEALLGELFLTNKIARLDEICELALTEGGIFDRKF